MSSLPPIHSFPDQPPPPLLPEAPGGRSRTVRRIVFAILGVVIGLPVIGLLILGSLMEAGVFPDSRALPGEKIDAKVRPFLEEAGLLEPGESIIYFYSGGIFSYREDGNYFTDQRVVSYTEVAGEIYSDELTYPEITDFEVEWSESFFEDSIIDVVGSDGDSFDLWVSNEEDGDHEFHRLLKKEWLLRRDH